MPQPLGRQAPPVSVTSHGGAVWRWTQATIAAAGVGTLWCWAGLHGLWGPWAHAWAGDTPAHGPSHEAFWLAAPLARYTLLGLSALLAAGVAGVWTWRRVRQGPRTLAWDGQAWWLDAQPAAPHTLMDLQSWLLLRVQTAAGRPQWVALSARHATPAAWHGLRAALYSRATSTSPPPAGGPPA